MQKNTLLHLLLAAAVAFTASQVQADPKDNKPGKAHKAEQKAQKAGQKAQKSTQAGYSSDSGAVLTGAAVTGAALGGGTVAINSQIGGVNVTAGISFGQARELAVSYQQTGYQQLPPGIRKNLARGKPLPPGIAKKLGHSQMLSQLPQHEGYQWQVCGTDLVLVSIATLVVADILTDVFR
ncbi:anti-virulence regulator CigR family protein [Rheinheimera sp.]|uniref:anti-virulence regulator CigR family protein n=1 Tax=Rheinheimera sp. TaxID=1869214 RepID=UPI002FDDE66C